MKRIDISSREIVFLIFSGFWLVIGWLIGSLWVALLPITYGWICHLVGQVAERKNRNYLSFVVLTAVFPLLTPIIVAVMANPNKN